MRALFVLLSLAFAAPAHAQEGWLVLEAPAEGEAAASRLAAAVRADLGGASVAPGSARARLHATLSQPASPVPAPLAAELVAQDRALLQRVAFGDDVAEDTDALLARAERHLAALGRRPDLAEPLGNVCLYGLRAHLQRDRRAAAAQQGLRCLALLPDLAPDPDLHPPRVRRTLERARVAREALAARLVVMSGPDDPGDCAVRVQGRRLGSTPRAEAVLVPGRVAVQVECDAEPGRVHGAVLRAGEATPLEVHVSLDRALVDDGTERVALRYASAARREALRATPASRLARALRLEAVVLVWQETEASHLLRVDADGQVTAARIRRGDDTARQRAVDALRARRSVDLGPSRPVLEAGRGPVTPRAAPTTGGAWSGRRTPTSLGFGYGFVLVGVGALAGGWGSYVRWRETQDTLAAVDDVRFDQRLQQGDRALRASLTLRREQRLQTLALGGGGAGFLSLAMPLLLPERDGVPWGAWVAGVVGGGALAAGLRLGRTHETPNPEGLRFSQEQPLAGLIALHGAPLLTIPLVYVLRWAVKGRGGDPLASASLDPTPGGARLTLRLAL